MKQDPLVSIVIPTYRSANALSSVLRSIEGQTYGKIEVMVVDRPSNDGTEELVKGHNYLYIPCRSERTRAMNLGAKSSKGQMIYFIGSDYVLESRVVEEAVKAISRDAAHAVIVPNLVQPTGFWSSVRWLEKECYVGDNSIEAARFVVREAFFGVGGFDEDIFAYEEHDLHNRLLASGYTVTRLRDVKELNIGEPDSLATYVRKYYYYGKCIGIYLDRYPEKSLHQLAPIRAAFVRHWTKFARYPALAVGFVIYQFARYVSTGMGFIVASVERTRRSKAQTCQT